MKPQASMLHQRTYHFLRDLCAGSNPSGVILPDGRALHLENWNLADIGTLPVCAEITHKYLRLKPGDVALISDPSTGGSCLSQPTLITSLHLGETELLLAKRFTTTPILQPQTFNERNLKIPPTPIYASGQLNETILEAIQQHPQCPADFKANFFHALHQLQNSCQMGMCTFSQLGIDLSRSGIKNYLADSRNVLLRAMAELPTGETLIQANFDSGERVKLAMEIGDEHVICDFAGTDSSRQFHLTNSTTAGICFGTFLTLLSQPIPANAGTFQIFEVRTPAESFLNAKPTASTFMGVFIAAPRLAQLIFNGLEKLNPRMQLSESPAAGCFVEFQFANAPTYFDWVAGGSPANSIRSGDDMVSPWQRIKPLSVEQAERIHPVQIVCCAPRVGSGGVGKHRGGAGVVKSYRLLQAAKICWWLEGSKLRPAGVHGAKDGAVAEAFVTRSAGHREDLSQTGEADLQAGDVLTLVSATAGGYGHIEVEESEI